MTASAFFRLNFAWLANALSMEGNILYYLACVYFSFNICFVCWKTNSHTPSHTHTLTKHRDMALQGCECFASYSHRLTLYINAYL